MELITDLLFRHDVVSLSAPACPDSRIKVCDGILCLDGMLCVFTNGDDCEKYGRSLGERPMFQKNSVLGIACLPFGNAVNASDNYKVPL